VGLVNRLRRPVHGATPSKGQTLRQRPNWSPLDPTLRLRAAGGRKGKPSIFFAPLPAPASDHSKNCSTHALDDAIAPWH
jgi:hypothetical protein